MLPYTQQSNTQQPAIITAQDDTQPCAALSAFADPCQPPLYSVPRVVQAQLGPTDNMGAHIPISPIVNDPMVTIPYG